MQLDLTATCRSPKGKLLERYTSFLMSAKSATQLDPMAERIRQSWVKKHPKGIITIDVKIS